MIFRFFFSLQNKLVSKSSHVLGLLFWLLFFRFFKNPQLFRSSICLPKIFYIKIVVIVNDENSVDKSLFFHRIMDLAEK